MFRNPKPAIDKTYRNRGCECTRPEREKVNIRVFKEDRERREDEKMRAEP